MPAVFQIVSRSSGKALAQSNSGFAPQDAAAPSPSGPEPSPPPPGAGLFVVQLTQSAQDPTQLWVLTPQDSAQDVLIQPFGSLDGAIGLYDLSSGEGVEPESGKRGDCLMTLPAANGVVWRIGEHPPYFFLLEGPNDLLMDLPGGTTADTQIIQIFTRNEHNNQQWTFLPVFAQLGNDG